MLTYATPVSTHLIGSGLGTVQGTLTEQRFCKDSQLLQLLTEQHTSIVKVFGGSVEEISIRNRRVPTLTWGCHGKSCYKMRQRELWRQSSAWMCLWPKIDGRWRLCGCRFRIWCSQYRWNKCGSATTWKETRLFVDGSTERIRNHYRTRKSGRE
jgi:hypothetical protein